MFLTKTSMFDYSYDYFRLLLWLHTIILMFDYFFIAVCQQNIRILEKNIKQVINNSYYSAKPKVHFLSNPMIRPGGKDPISNKVS